MFRIALGLLAATTIAAAEPPLPGTSLYHLDATWVSEQERPTVLRSLRGKPVLLAMFFSHCDQSCPLAVARMKTIESRLTEPDRVRFVLVSFDSERDDPERLRRFRDRMGLDPARWTLLHGDEGPVRELAAVLGIRYRQEEGGAFVHSDAIHLLDTEGRPAARFEGAATDPADVVRLLEDSPRQDADPDSKR